jgi:hypothetical protein
MFLFGCVEGMFALASRSLTQPVARMLAIRATGVDVSTNAAYAHTKRKRRG